MSLFQQEWRETITKYISTIFNNQTRLPWEIIVCHTNSGAFHKVAILTHSFMIRFSNKMWRRSLGLPGTRGLKLLFYRQAKLLKVCLAGSFPSLSGLWKWWEIQTKDQRSSSYIESPQGHPWPNLSDSGTNFILWIPLLLLNVEHSLILVTLMVSN